MVIKTTLLKKLVVLGVGLLIVSGAGVGYAAMTFQENPPQVESVDSEWGDVTKKETEVRTTVVVNNPNDIPVPGVAGITYTATLNDVVIMEGSKSSVGISPGRNEVEIPATMENRAIAEWWVTHVNNGEVSEMSVRATLNGPGGYSRPVTSQSSSFETDMLGPMQTDEPTVVTLQGEEFIVLQEQSASWGEATMAETPIHFSAVIENRHDRSLTLDGIGYEIRMNNVTVGSGQVEEGVSVEPGETGTISVDAAIDTETMADWWATHVKNDETTRMSVAMYGLVEQDGELVRVPIELFEKDLQFETNMLEGGETSVQPIQDAGDDGSSYEQPTVVETSQEWGTVTDETTEVLTTVTVENPNEGSMNEFVTLDVGQRVTINDVTVANDSANLGTIDSGTTDLQTTVAKDNSKVPEWWVHHVNDGEQSSVVVDPSATADLGFTRFDVSTSPQTTAVSTTLLSGLNNSTSRPVTVDGQEVAVVHETSATWGTATTQRSPITVAVTIENQAPTPLTIEDLAYTIRMNDVTAGDGTASESYTIQPGVTRTVTFTLVVDSQQMDEWWVSHVRNDERTVVDFDATATVSSGGKTEQVQLDGITTRHDVQTDFLNRTG